MKKSYMQNIALITIVLGSIYSWNNYHSDISEPIPMKINSHEKNESAESKMRSFGEMQEFQFNRLKNPKTNKIPQNIRAKELEFAKHLPTYKKTF